MSDDLIEQLRGVKVGDVITIYGVGDMLGTTAYNVRKIVSLYDKVVLPAGFKPDLSHVRFGICREFRGRTNVYLGFCPRKHLVLRGKSPLTVDWEIKRDEKHESGTTTVIALSGNGCLNFEGPAQKIRDTIEALSVNPHFVDFDRIMAVDPKIATAKHEPVYPDIPTTSRVVEKMRAAFGPKPVSQASKDRTHYVGY